MQIYKNTNKNKCKNTADEWAVGWATEKLHFNFWQWGEIFPPSKSPEWPWGPPNLKFGQ